MKRLAGTLSLLLLAVGVFAQFENPLLRQYVYNDFVINPAAAGTKPYNPASLNYRKQWVGIQDAPTFQSFMMHGLLYNQKVGIGGAIYYSSFGPTSQAGFEFAYAYHIQIKPEFSKLSFGIAAQCFQYLLNEKTLKFDQPNDPAVQQGPSRVLWADATAGIYYFSEKYNPHTYYFGFSANNIVPTEITSLSTNNMSLVKQPRRYNLNGAYQIKIATDLFVIEPSFLLKYYESGPNPLKYDLTGRILIKNTIWGGLSYRKDEALVAIFGLNAKVMRLGYAYDMGYANINKYAPVSHEIYLSLYINRRELKKM